MTKPKRANEPPRKPGEPGEEQGGERIQKYLARAGVASRRRAEDLVREGRVQINGQVVAEMGARVAPGDVVSVDGKPVASSEKTVYLALHKPPGYLSTAKDERGRPTVLDLVDTKERVYPVGRLDLGSEGLILLTNDGELAHRLIHPSYEVEREYEVLVNDTPSEEALRRLRSGVELEDGLTWPARVEALGRDGADSWLRFTIHEGRKRQVRRMCEAVGHQAIRLIRTRIGPIRLGKLRQGEYRRLSANEVTQLRRVSSQPRRSGEREESR